MIQKTYHGFTQRLKEERMRAGLSQSETARKLRISQSHYSKVEQARRRLGFYETKWLCETEFDVFYIFTGQRAERLSGDFFEQCEYRELLCYLNLVCMWITQLGKGDSTCSEPEEKRMLAYARYALVIGQDERIIFKLYRDYSEYTQDRMAKELGIDIKKFRDLEKGKTLPDSELIWKMSAYLHIPFSLILKDSNGLIGEIRFLMKQMDPERRKWLLENMKKYHDEINRSP